MEEGAQSKISNPPDASTVVGTKEECTPAALAAISSEGKTEKKQSPSAARMDKFDDVRATHIDADTNRPDENPCRTIEDAGMSIAKNLGARSDLVERATNDDCSGSMPMSAVEQSVPQVESVGLVTLDVMSRGAYLPLSGCAHSPRMPSASTRLTRTAVALRALGGGSSMSVYLPSKSQHALLTHLQGILEISCYEFAKRIMPDILQRRGWDCAESVELNRWTDEFQRRQKCFSAAEHTGKPLKILLRSIANIRHCAVHRRKVNVKGIRQFILDAEALAKLFEDTKRGEQISALRQEMQMAVKEPDRYRILFYEGWGRS